MNFDEDWLRFGDENCLIFSPEHTVKFEETMYFSSDGTFETSSNAFTQHFIIMYVEKNEKNEEFPVICGNVSV